MSRLCKVYNLSKRLTEYEEIWRLQKFLQNQTWAEKKIGAQTVDTLVLVQHQHVYTLGRGATVDNVKFRSEDKSMPLFRIERGGEVTYHGPGQLVVYPIFDLDRHKRDLHWFSRSLEQTVIDTLKYFQINSDRSSLNAGVWIDNKKISAQGITASRWITLHGVAFNVNTDLDRYNKIIPCGLDPSVAGVCSLQSLSGEKQEWNLAGVSEQWLKSISNVFNLQLDFVKNPEEILSKLSFSEPMHLERVTVPIVE